MHTYKTPHPHPPTPIHTCPYPLPHTHARTRAHTQGVVLGWLCLHMLVRDVMSFRASLARLRAKRASISFLSHSHKVSISCSPTRSSQSLSLSTYTLFAVLCEYIHAVRIHVCTCARCPKSCVHRVRARCCQILRTYVRSSDSGAHTRGPMCGHEPSLSIIFTQDIIQDIHTLFSHKKCPHYYQS